MKHKYSAKNAPPVLCYRSPISSLQLVRTTVLFHLCGFYGYIVQMRACRYFVFCARQYFAVLGTKNIITFWALKSSVF